MRILYPPMDRRNTHMVIFMVKLAFAMIPAAIILTFIVLAMIAVAARVTGVT